MIEIPIRQGGVIVAHAIVDDVDGERLARWSWRLNARGYVVRSRHRGSQIRMANEVFGDRPPDTEVDHINRNPLDNRRSNLRAGTHAENMQNVPARGRYRGVARYGSRWKASGVLAGKRYHLGVFDTEIAAGQAAASWRAEHMPFSEDARG